MSEEQRCPECGLQKARYLGMRTQEQPWGNLEVHLYAKSTVPLCYGHHAAHFTGTIEELEQYAHQQAARGEVLFPAAMAQPGYVFCPQCRYHIHIEHVHMEAECEALQQGKTPQPERIAIPAIFSESFGDEEVSL